MLRPTLIICASCCCHAAFAQSSVTLGGFLDDGIVYVNHSAPTSNVAGQKVFQMASSSESRWGLTGHEDLGGGTRAIFRLENGFNMNSGVLSEGGRLFGRQAIVGLESPHAGRLTFGRDYDFGAEYVGTLVSSKQWAGGMGTHVGDSDNLYNSFRLNNTVKWTTPDIRGLVLGGGYAFSNQASDTGGAGFANDRAYTFGARYQHGPLVAAVAYLEVNQPAAGNAGGSNPSGAVTGDYVNRRNIFYGPVTRQRIATGGANYTSGPFVVGLVYSWVDLDYADATSLRLSNFEANIRYRLSPAWQAGAAFIYTDGHANGGDSIGKFAVGNRPKWEQVNLGLNYALSKRTGVYAVIVWQEAVGDANQAAIFNSGGLSGATSRSQVAAALGLRTRF